MGSWGAKLYQNDIACDVKEYFIDQLHREKSAKYITQSLICQYEDILLDIDDASDFWFALADTQWNYGMLDNFVKDQALKHIHNGSGLTRWIEAGDKNKNIRIKVINELEQKLLSPQSTPKKVKPYKLYYCKWKTGDVFAYNLQSEYAKEKRLFNKYLIIIKVGEYKYYPGHIVPIIRLKITTDNYIPKNESEINSLEYIQTDFRKFDPLFQEFRVDSKNISEEEYFKRIEIKKASYEYDNFGFLPLYQLRLLITSEKKIPQNLVLIGNFLNIVPPNKEFVPKNMIELPSIETADFDKCIIEKYYNFNLRNSKIYRNN